MNIFGHNWRVRSGLEGGKINYDPALVSSTAKVIKLDASKGSVGIQLVDNLGWGTYTTIYDARPDAHPPETCLTTWLHDDMYPGVEIDYEHNLLGSDPNCPTRHNLSLVDAYGNTLGTPYRAAPTAFTRYRVSLTATPWWQSVKVEGWRDSAWVVVGFARWDIRSASAGQFKAAVWWMKPSATLKKWSAAPVMTITDFKFTPMT